MIRAALSCPDRPVTLEEFLEFWESLSEEEKAYFRNATPEELGL